MSDDIKIYVMLLTCLCIGFIAGYLSFKHIKTTVPIEPYKIEYVKTHGKILKTYYYK